MVKLIRTLAPENGMHFEDICSFETTNYIGIWNAAADRFALVAKSDIEFHLIHLPQCTDINRLDELVYVKCEEHIVCVSDRSCYAISLTED